METQPTESAGGCRGALRQFDSDEGGAVILAALAACLLLLTMTAMLWDTGKVVRAKTKLQTATDSAAFTKAAIEARSMNYVAFANVGKRTVVGLHNSYRAYIAAWDSQTAAQCAASVGCCAALNPGCCTNLCGYQDCFGNLIYFMAESSDFSDFAGRTLPAAWGGIGVESGLFWWADLDGDAQSKFGREVKALDQFQQYLKQITPWWSFLASSVRGARNGATTTTSWPLPPTGDASPFGINYRNFKAALNTLTRVDDWISGSRSSEIPNTNMPSVMDKLPVARNRDKRSNNCVVDMGPPGRSAEFAGNHLLHQQNSGSPPFKCKVDPGSYQTAIWAMGWQIGACYTTGTVNPRMDQHMDPFTLNPGMAKTKKNELARSTIVLGYRHVDNIHHSKYGLNPGYESARTWSGPVTGRLTGNSAPHYEPNGVWSMARAEVTSPEKYQQWMWTTGWTARMRPMAYRGELDIRLTRSWPLVGDVSGAGGRVSMSTIALDVTPLMLPQATAFSSLNGFNFNPGNSTETLRDFEYMLMKAADSMTADNVHSVPK